MPQPHSLHPQHARIGLILLAATLYSTTGCANRLLVGQPATYRANETPTIDVTRPGVERHHIDTTDGTIEVYCWNFSNKALRNWLVQDATLPREHLPDLLILFSPPGGTLVQEWDQYISAVYAGTDVGVIGWNYPGVGSSSGPPSLVRNLNAALAVFDYLRQRGAQRPIVLHGAALGGCLALHAATEREVAGVLVDSPLRANLIPLQAQHGWWNLWIGAAATAIQVPAEYDVAESAHRSVNRGPLLIIHGESDDQAPPQHAADVYNRWPYLNKKLWLVPEAGHFPATYETAPGEYRTTVINFLVRAAQQARRSHHAGRP